MENIAEDRKNVPNLHTVIPKVETYRNLCIAPHEPPVWKQLAANAIGVKAGITPKTSKEIKIHILQSRNVREVQREVSQTGSANEQAKVSNQPCVGRRVAI